MKQDDIVRVTRAIEPGKDLKMKILKSAVHPRGFRLDNPLRVAMAFGAAVVLCACAVGAVILFGGDSPKNGSTAALLAPKPSASGAAATPNESPWPSDAAATPNESPTPNDAVTANTTKLEDVVPITQRDGKWYADKEKLTVIAAVEGEFGLDSAWVQKAVNGELTKEEILAEFAKADERAANYTPPEIKGTLPDGVLSPQEAVVLARKEFTNVFGITLGDCPVVDCFSGSQPRLLGRNEPVDDSQLKKEHLEVWFVDFTKGNGQQHTGKAGEKYVWTVDYFTASGKGQASITLDASTGLVLKGDIVAPQPIDVNFSDNDLNKREKTVRSFVESLNATQGASITKVEYSAISTGYTVYLSNNMIAGVTLDKDGQVIFFELTTR